LALNVLTSYSYAGTEQKPIIYPAVCIIEQKHFWARSVEFYSARNQIK
jgi:hypothetical protein